MLDTFTYVANGQTFTATVDVATRPTTHRGVPVGYITKPTTIINTNLTVADGQIVTGVEVRGSVTVQDGGTFKNANVVGTAAGGASQLVTVLDGTRALVEDVTIIPQNPWPRTSYGIRLAGGVARRLNIGFVGDPIGFIRNTVTVEDTWTHDQVLVVSASQAGGYSHDDAAQMHAGWAHRCVGNLFDAYLTALYGEGGKPPVYDQYGKYVSGNPNYPDLQAMAGLMITPSSGSMGDLYVAWNEFNGGASAINAGALGSGPGTAGYTAGIFEDNVFGTDQGNHPKLAAIMSNNLPRTWRRNYYKDGSVAVPTQS